MGCNSSSSTSMGPTIVCPPITSHLLLNLLLLINQLQTHSLHDEIFSLIIVPRVFVISSYLFQTKSTCYYFSSILIGMVVIVAEEDEMESTVLKLLAPLFSEQTNNNVQAVAQLFWTIRSSPIYRIRMNMRNRKEL